MASAWPTSTAPFKPLVDGYKEQLGENWKKFTPTAGKTIKRRRGSARVDTLQIRIYWTKTQYEAALAFYKSTLYDGSLPFTAPHPRTGVTTEFSFASPMDPELVGNMKYMVSMSLEYFP